MLGPAGCADLTQARPAKMFARLHTIMCAALGLISFQTNAGAVGGTLAPIPPTTQQRTRRPAAPQTHRKTSPGAARPKLLLIQRPRGPKAPHSVQASPKKESQKVDLER